MIPLWRRFGLWLRLLNHREIYFLIIGAIMLGWFVVYLLARWGAGHA